jgi:predicted acylesterase/phospholipase RssA
MSDPILERLQAPIVPDDNNPHCFRLGLVLSGTVSSGAWTAGVLDALVEALDAWEAAKAAGDKVPRHRVRLEVVGGASGGAVCGALLARAAWRRFPHVRAEADAGAAGNPFWQVWVEALDVAAMLETATLGETYWNAAGEAQRRRPQSLLSGLAIQKAVEGILRWEGGGTIRRRWLADPFHLLVTQTNLRGVPYSIAFQPAAGSDSPRASQFVAHADHVLFALPAPGTGEAGRRPDEFLVEAAFADATEAWTTLAEHARASGAFPMGFPPMRISRPRDQYDWRGVMVPGGPGEPAQPRRLVPAWGAEVDINYTYDAVDGGALNNSPFRLVHETMAGLGKQFDRDVATARAGIVLVDPFAAAPPLPLPAELPDLLGVAGGTIGALIAHGRYATSDLLLALDGKVGSRFLLTAGRRRTLPGLPEAHRQAWGEAALATAGLGAFLGFIDRRLRVHDYLLGRSNALGWMRRHFTLPAGNPLFAGFGATPEAAPFLVGGRLPVIPVVPGPAAAQPAWPVPGADLDDLQRRTATRLREVADGLADFTCAALVSGAIGTWGAKKARAMIDAALKDLAARA